MYGVNTAYRKHFFFSSKQALRLFLLYFYLVPEDNTPPSFFWVAILAHSTVSMEEAMVVT